MPSDLRVHWRDSALTPKFYIFDARAALALLLWIMHWRMWCFELFVGILFASAVLNYFNLPIMVAIRIIKNFLAGKKRIIFKYE